MSNLRTGFALTIGLSLLPLTATAAFESSVSLFTGTIPGASEGGFGIGDVELSDEGELSQPERGYTWSDEGLASAAANSGTLAVRIVAGTDVEASASGFRGSSGGSALAYLSDEIVVAPGTSGLSVGSIAQIQFEVSLAGEVLIQGVPSSLSILDFEMATFTTGGLPLKLVDYSTGNMNPAQSFTVDDVATFVVDVQVGNNLPFSASLDMDLGSTEFPPDTMFDPMTGEGMNLIDFAASVRITHAPGFEGLDLETDSGAPVGAPPVPASGWSSPLLFGLLIVTGLAAQRRRRLRFAAGA